MIEMMSIEDAMTGDSTRNVVGSWDSIYIAERADEALAVIGLFWAIRLWLERASVARLEETIRVQAVRIAMLEYFLRGIATDLDRTDGHPNDWVVREIVERALAVLG